MDEIIQLNSKNVNALIADSNFKENKEETKINLKKDEILGLPITQLNLKKKPNEIEKFDKQDSNDAKAKEYWESKYIIQEIFS